jgi:hypothetical protein
MQYTPDEISKIHLLAEHPDLNNVLLAFELIKGRGIVPELVDDIYWIYNRLIWAVEHRMAKQVFILFQSYGITTSSITNIPQEELLYLDAQIDRKASILKLNLSLLSQRLFQYFPNPSKDFIIRFLFKNGTDEIQKKTLPLLKSREHTGRFLLNLGGLNLKKIPAIVLREKHIQILKIWGNHLEELPDFWDQFQFLETLNIAENNLKTLPPSFATLQKLQRLYAQNNQFEISPLLDQIKQLGKINYLSITTNQKEQQSYAATEQELLKQLEGLVNHGKIHASEKEQNLFLALVMNKESALQALNLSDLFEALSDRNEVIQKQAKTKILNWKGSVFSGQIPSNASIAILGFVSFATRNRITELEFKGIKFTTELTPNTTHIVLGDLPEVSERIKDTPFIFMTEEDLELDLKLRY